MLKTNTKLILLSIALCCFGFNTAKADPSAHKNKVQKEVLANSVLSSLRTKMLAQPGTEGLFTHFVEHKQEADTGKLYKLMLHMPKGGLLHTHLGGFGDMRELLRMALAREDGYVWWGADTTGFVHGQIAFLPYLKNIYKNKSLPEQWRPLRLMQAACPSFADTLLRLCTLGPEDKGKPVWEEFERLFMRDGLLLSYKPIFVASNTEALKQMAREGLQFVDIRLRTSETVYTTDGRTVGCDSIMAIYDDVLKEVRKTYPYFDIRYIYCSYKHAEPSDVAKDLLTAESLAARHPGRVIGFDLVGEEDTSRPLTDFDQVLMPGKRTLPLLMHAGETRRTSNTNIREALRLGATRIGHGVNLYHFPSDIIRVKAQHTLIEACPLSNQILGYVDDLRQHPAKEYMAQGIPICLNSDDAALFRTSNITDDVFMAYVAWNLTLKQLKQCLLNSILVSHLTKAQQQKHLKVFNQHWDAFVQEVCQQQNQ